MEVPYSSIPKDKTFNYPYLNARFRTIRQYQKEGASTFNSNKKTAR